LFALWLAIATAVEDAACYDPEGNFAPGYFPCNPTAFITSCCPAGYGCYSNSLCVVVEGNVAQPNLTVGSVRRAMCTNPEWTSEICGKFCLDGES
jgi:hypothetical protein